MIFSVDGDKDDLDQLPEQDFSRLDVLERENLQEWAIREPRILGEELLIITSEYSGFEDIRDRLDILALDRDGKLVVVELKRDRADRTTDLQAIKYASYCATLTAEDIQKEYREFWNDREDKPVTPEDVGQRFADFVGETIDEDVPFTQDGWTEFDLDEKPRILLAAGRFGTEVTSPVMWLIEEYGLDITCTTIEAYEHQGRILLNSQQVIPVSEAEEYMTKRREKQEKQESSPRRPAAINVLLDREVVNTGTKVYFDIDQVSGDPSREWSEADDFWFATITGKTGQSNNIRWHHDDNEYSFSGLTRRMLNELIGRDIEKAVNGYKFWCHPEYDDRTLDDLRNSNIRG